MLVSIDSIPHGGKLPGADSEKAKTGDLSLFHKAIDAKNNDQHEKDADSDSSTERPLDGSAKPLLPDHSSVSERIAGELDGNSSDLLAGDSADYIDDLLVLDNSVEVASEAGNISESATVFKTEGFGIVPEGFGRMTNGAFSGSPDIEPPAQSAQPEQPADKGGDVDTENERVKTDSKPELPEPVGTFNDDAIAMFLSGGGDGPNAYAAAGFS